MVFFSLFMMYPGIELLAQMKIVSPDKNMTVKVLRCEVAGEDCVVDMLFENIGLSDVEVAGPGYVYQQKAYDDMGNVYGIDSGKIIYLYVGTMQRSLGSLEKFDLPQGIPVKVRAVISDVSDIATAIKRLDIKLRFFSPWLPGERFVKILNIPISR